MRFLSPNFYYTGKTHVRLNDRQLRARDTVRQKIESGVYEFEGAPCPCGGSEDGLVAETDRYGLRLNTVICRKCGLLRTDPRLTERSLRMFYEKDYRDLYMGEEYGDMENYFRGMVRRGTYMKDLLKDHVPGLWLKGMDVLEVGCSAGGILEPFLKAGARVKGYDYDKRYLEYGNSRNKGLNLCCGGLEDLRDEIARYDIIIMNHVLEHVIDIRGAIELIKNSLKKNGIFYVSVPGARNPEYYFSPSKSFIGTIHIAHLYHFTKATLANFLEGFSCYFIDDTVRGIFRVGEDVQKTFCDGHDECPEMLDYIKKYEQGTPSKVRRSLMKMIGSRKDGLAWRLYLLKAALRRDN